jgi:hypothetical protein
MATEERERTRGTGVLQRKPSSTVRRGEEFLMRRAHSRGSGAGLACLVVLGLIAVPLLAGTVYAFGWDWKGGGIGGHDNVGLDTPRPKVLATKNVEVIGWNDMQGRGTLQVTAKGNWVYAGHHNGHAYNPLTGVDEWNGTTIFDVSNPAKPKITAHIPNEENTNSRSAQVVYNLLAVSGPHAGHKRDYLVRNKETSSWWGLEIFDITDRYNPEFVSKLNIGYRNMVMKFFHKGWWSEKSLLYYAACREVGNGAYLEIFDLKDPYNPKAIAEFMLPGQDVAGDTRTWHHPIVDEENNRVYGAYLEGGDVIAADIAKILAHDTDHALLWHIDADPPYRGTHTVAPIFYDDVPNFGKDALPRAYVLVSDEGTDNKCSNPIRAKSYVFDITDAEETGVPFPVETWQVPDTFGGVDYCAKGARFGPHQFAETIDTKNNRFEDKIAYYAYFNAGLRVVDISNPYILKEVGYLVPDASKLSFPIATGQPVVAVANDVDVDYRGLVYMSDRVGGGLWVLDYTPRYSIKRK